MLILKKISNFCVDAITLLIKISTYINEYVSKKIKRITMFAWLKKINIFSNLSYPTIKGIAEHPFYNQRLSLAGNHLTVTQHQDDEQVMDLKDIRWITIIHHGESLSGYPNCWLYIRCGNKYTSICTVAAYYNVFENYILNLDHFDKTLYWSIKDKTVMDNELLLYKSSLENNFEIKPQKNMILPLDEGIILENLNMILPWVDYDQLEIPNMVVLDKQAINPDYEGKKFLIKSVQIFNGLILDNLYTETHYSTNLNLSFPIICYESDITANEPKAAFGDLVKHFNHCFQIDNKFEEEYDDLKYHYQQGDTTLILKCVWNDRLKNYDDQLYLTIEKKPNLDRFYVSEELNNLLLNKLYSCCIETGYEDRTTYLDVDNKFYTPKHFNLKDEQTLIWRSDEKQIIGISNSDFTRIFKLKDVSSIVLNIANCRGYEGRNFLHILDGFNVLSGGISVGDTSKWISMKEEINRLLNIPFDVEYFDDHY